MHPHFTSKKYDFLLKPQTPKDVGSSSFQRADDTVLNIGSNTDPVQTPKKGSQ